jgi:hypothetical protein
MVNKNEFQNVMLELAACRLSPEEWSAWWAKSEPFVREFLNRGEYLRLKPINHGFRWVPILTSQKEAIRYLEQSGLPFESSNTYQENYMAELDESVQRQKAREKVLLAELKIKYPQLWTAYPRFCNSLKNAFAEGDKIEPGISETQIKAMPFDLPADIESFFKTVSVITLEGISIDFAAIRTETLCGKEYIVLGEFWKDADGDLLLIKMGETASPTPIYYYCHEIDKVKKLCSSIGDLMEKKFRSYFINS